MKFDNNKGKVKTGKKPVCSNCGTYDNLWGCVIFGKLKNNVFPKKVYLCNTCFGHLKRLCSIYGGK